MLGSNVPTIGGLPKGFDYAKEWGCDAIQIYVSLSRRWHVPELSAKEINTFRSAWQESSVKEVVAHVPFLVNLASPNNEIYQKSISRLIVEINRAAAFGVRFLVLHPGFYLNSSPMEGLKRVVAGLNTALANVEHRFSKILLETMAGQGTSLGASFDEIAYILENVHNPDFCGVCFDTGHVFMAGYNMSGYKGYKETLGLFNQMVGIDKIKVFHLNDSKTNMGSKTDRHANIGEGKMGLEVFHAIIKDPRFLGVAKILEIPERDKKSKENLELLRKLESE
jgi:deoxyribonuclease-4